MCREAPDELLDLEHLGVTFHRNEEGQLGTRAFGGASAARTYYVADITGQAILHVLYEQLMKYEEVDRYEEWFTTALVQDEDGRIAGAITRNIRDGSLELFSAKAVILATRRQRPALQPDHERADLHRATASRMAYRIGAPLMDMEMIQYHPTTLAGNGLLITEGARGEGAHLYNAQGERFMEKYAPNKMELASRDVVSRAEQTEINEGRGFPDGTVALDITVVPRKRIHEALREIVNVGRDFAGVDITREPIHIKPGNHYMMGGVKTDVDGQTDIPGLYAAGECACVSVHGGNRLGANSLLDTLVFGRRSGAARGRSRARPAAARARLRAARGRGAAHRRDRRARPAAAGACREIKAELGATMDKYVAVFRDEAGLHEALEVVRRLKEEAKTSASTTRARVFNQDVLGALELQFMLDNAEAIVISARSSARRAAAPSSAPTSPSATTRSGSSTSTSRRTAASRRSPTREVTMTQWEPEERTY